MLRHQGKKRTFKHNLRLATLLSFIAGLVNISGVLGVNILTTNVTGHFAFFSEQLMQRNYLMAIHFLLFIFSFLLGAFSASFITELSFSRSAHPSHKNAIILEILILLVIGLYGPFIHLHSRFPVVASLLLFAMGIQNSLVTRISDSVVRTTHLTGLFTDLGIELSQLFFHKRKEQRVYLKERIRLRLSIISFFFLGGVAGGELFSTISFKTLIIAAVLLIIALINDWLLFNYYRLIRKRRLRNY